MTQGVLQIRKLNVGDYDFLKKMDTGIGDDYVVRIFPGLVKSTHQAVYGLFDSEKMHLLSIAGYTIFARKFAVLGRLRSDRRFLSKGHATRLVQYIIDDLKTMPEIKWIGANTQMPNVSARRVLEKLGLSPNVTFYSTELVNREKITGTDGELWTAVNATEEKRALLTSVQNNQLGMFPYECYYPLPFDEILFTDSYLDDCFVYKNRDSSRFFLLMEDQKGDVYAHLKYFWDDAFEQPGFWKTVFHAMDTIFTEHKLWVDFSENGFQHIPAPEAFDIQKPWILYSL
ncbi:MAG: GNAT family N-acetyltransferase [Bacillaceae bacterium]|nr:GNAT family N-acetyltransferase [Bacillaceae bacterium]